MPSALPEGDPAPDDGRLPDEVVAEVGRRPFGIYLHVPFCTTRCGYCDFNTYTATELGPDPGASRLGYVDRAITELDLAVATLGPDAPEVSTVFVGGGTPTLLPPADLARFLAAVDDRFGLAADAEVTTESNPDSIDAAGLATLREAGFTRVSFGMQSAVPHVLATLDRVHTPGRAQRAVADAWAAGFDHVSLDLIYGTPGESASDWATSVEAALAAGPDHVSAYALIVEEGTRLAARVRRGELPMPDDDGLADAYVAADDAFSAAGLDAYEVSNWARDDAARCRHNLGYWRGDDWWGWDPGRTATSPACAGGTSSTPPRTPPGWPRAAHPRPGASCSTPTSAGSSGCCSRSGSPRVSPSTPSPPRSVAACPTSAGGP